MATRLNLLAMDKPELQYSVKEASRHMAGASEEQGMAQCFVAMGTSLETPLQGGAAQSALAEGVAERLAARSVSASLVACSSVASSKSSASEPMLKC